MKVICLNPFFLMLVLPQITWQNSTTFPENNVQELLDTYAAYQIPKNGTNPLLVTISVNLCNVLNVDLMKYSMTTVLLLNQSWYNTQMAWDKAKFHFTTLTVPWDSVWTPSHTIKEALDTSWKTDSPTVVLHSDGKAEFLLALSIDSNCNFDLFYYPWDRTRCSLTFFTLGHRVNEIEFKVSIENYILSARREYTVSDVSIVSKKNMPHPFFLVMVTLENRGFRVFFSLIVPSFALVVADLCGFLIPLRDRLSYMITLLLAYLVFHSSLVGSLPGSSSCFPLLSYYYIGLLGLLFISTIETILVTKLVAANSHLSQNYGSQKQKAETITGLNKNESNYPESTKDSIKNDCRSNKDTSHLIQSSVNVDKIFFFIYIGLVISFHLLFLALWLFWKCQSEKSPGEDYLNKLQQE